MTIKPIPNITELCILAQNTTTGISQYNNFGRFCPSISKAIHTANKPVAKTCGRAHQKEGTTNSTRLLNIDATWCSNLL